MDFSNYIFRCSQLGKLMTEPRSKEEKAKGLLGQTAKSYLEEIHRSVVYNRKTEYSSKYIEKGLSEEESAITLFSRVKKRYFRKNTERLTNDYVTGEPDLFNGKTIQTAIEGWDTKCSWDLFSFPYPTEPLNKDYFYQDHGYMWLTGAERWTTVYCLVNAPANLVTQEKKNTWFRMDCPDETNDNYIEKCIEIEKNMIYDYKQFVTDNPGYDFSCGDWKFDIPMNERIMEFTVERDANVIEGIAARIEKSRDHLTFLEDSRKNPIILAHRDRNLNATIVE